MNQNSRPHPFGDMPGGDNGFTPVAVPLVDQTQEMYDTTVSPWLGYECAQLFTPGISGMLRRVELNLEVKDISTVAVVTLYAARGGAPSSHPEDLVGRSAVLNCLRDGWNSFRFPKQNVSLTAGIPYALVLATSSACDWRVRTCVRPIPPGMLCQRWGEEPWEPCFPNVCATFRTYMGPFRSSEFPSFM
jgi:hypothetical protein